MENSSPFSFIDEFVEKIILDQGITLTAEQRNFYIPQLSAMAQERMGADLMDKLSPDHLGAFETLFSNPDATGEQWAAFWNQSIPNFSAEVEKSMASFADTVKELLARTA